MFRLLLWYSEQRNHQTVYQQLFCLNQKAETCAYCTERGNCGNLCYRWSWLHFFCLIFSQTVRSWNKFGVIRSHHVSQKNAIITWLNGLFSEMKCEQITGNRSAWNRWSQNWESRWIKSSPYYPVTTHFNLVKNSPVCLTVLWWSKKNIVLSIMDKLSF